MTQEYLSRKIVTAWAEDRRGDLPEDAEAGDEGVMLAGYGVKYENGHISWCPAPEFEQNSLALGNIAHLPAFQQRLLAETAELRQRTDGLSGYLTINAGKSAEELRMSPQQLTLLTAQNVAMQNLLKILDARIEDMSNPVGIAELFQPDPNLVETTQGYTEQIAQLKPLSYSDEWLREKLREAMVNPLDHSDFFGQWTEASNVKPLVARMPLASTKYNLFGLLTAQGQMPASADITDCIGIVGIKQISDPAGNLIGLSNFEYLKCDSLHVEMRASVVGEGKLVVVVNRQTCVAEILFEGLTKDLTIALEVDLVNHNRRPGQ